VQTADKMISLIDESQGLIGMRETSHEQQQLRNSVEKSPVKAPPFNFLNQRQLHALPISIAPLKMT
jgi:hypothetical protein